MINEYVHRPISFVIKNKKTGKTENLRRNHNWYANGKNWDDAKRKEQSRFKKEWNTPNGDYLLLSVKL